MRLITTLTVTYDEHEDRLHLAARCADGHEQGLWLTQRLANLLIRVLVDRLGQAAATAHRGTGQGAATGALQAGPREPEQDPSPEASGERREMSPVEVSRTTPHGLVHTINVVRHAGGGHHLVVRWDESRALALPLDGEALRRVLQILHLRYQTAEWNAPGVWPEGVEGLLQGGVPPDTVLH